MKKNLGLHPFLFALYPFLFLYVHNQDKLPLSLREGLFLSVGLLVLTGLAFCLLRLVIRDWAKAGIVTSLGVILFFSYGHAFKFLEQTLLLDIVVVKHRYVLVLFAGIFALGFLGTVRWLKNPGILTKFLNVMAFCLIAMCLVQFIGYHIQKKEKVSDLIGEEQSALMSSSSVTSKPNIFHIVLDAYGRSDVLKEIYEVDNSELLEDFESKGFHIARDSYAHYGFTFLSLASMLNMTYFDGMVERLGEDYQDRGPVSKMIRKNRVVSLLKQQGYEFAAFSSGVSETEMTHADKYLAPAWSFTEFTNTFINTTPLPLLSRSMEKLFPNAQNQMHRRRVHHVFEGLPALAESREPVYVFAHLLVPHAPFLFDEHGRSVQPPKNFLQVNDSPRTQADSARYVSDYRQQILYVNKLLRKTVERILELSEKPPIIIIHGDHGPWSDTELFNKMVFHDDLGKLSTKAMKERLGILNAYYFPGASEKTRHSDIALVNIFRALFNEYFGGNFEMLENKSYLSTFRYPYRLAEIEHSTLSGKEG